MNEALRTRVLDTFAEAYITVVAKEDGSTDLRRLVRDHELLAMLDDQEPTAIQAAARSVAERRLADLPEEAR